MSPKIEVIICGVNLAFAGWAMRLEATDQLRVQWLQRPFTAAIPELKLRAPDVVIYELKDDDPSLSAALVRKRPGLKLIGLDLEWNTVKICSGSERLALNTEELLRIIGV